MHKRDEGTRRPGSVILLTAICVALAACTRTTVPVAIERLVGPTALAEGINQEATEQPVDPDPQDFSVVWVPDGESLPVREGAGISAGEVGGLSANQRGIRLTGHRTSLGSSQWVEIQTNAGLVGWVPAWNLTEDVPQEVFCADARVERLADRLTTALQTEDGRLLEELVSPKRGLILRHDPWNPEVRIGADALLGLFDNPRTFAWGSRFTGGSDIEGSFAEIALPELLEVFTGEHEQACNQSLTGPSPDPFSWPSEYANLNFVSFHRPPPQGGNEYNWRTWQLAVEYVEGEPYIALLLQTRPPF